MVPARVFWFAGWKLWNERHDRGRGPGRQSSHAHLWGLQAAPLPGARAGRPAGLRCGGAGAASANGSSPAAVLRQVRAGPRGGSLPRPIQHLPASSDSARVGGAEPRWATAEGAGSRLFLPKPRSAGGARPSPGVSRTPQGRPCPVPSPELGSPPHADHPAFHTKLPGEGSLNGPQNSYPTPRPRPRLWGSGLAPPRMCPRGPRMALGEKDLHTGSRPPAGAP